jgi:hypothetical protein
MVLILCQRRRDPPAQLFQPFSQFIPVGLSSHTMLSIKVQCARERLAAHEWESGAPDRLQGEPSGREDFD